MQPPPPRSFLGQPQNPNSPHTYNQVIVSWEKVATMSDFRIHGRQSCEISEFCEPLKSKKKGSLSPPPPQDA